jgi:chemotaxis protein CheD
MTAFALPLDEGGTMPEIGRERRHLQPGQLFVAQSPTVISTILGSCVAVCLWDPFKGIGGMNHFMLPLHAGSAMQSPRFGNVAMEQLVTKLCDAGARLPNLRARVFGGSCMFKAMQSPDHLGSKNSALALEDLQRRGIEVVQSEVGGTRGRKLVFYSDTGAVWTNLI